MRGMRESVCKPDCREHEAHPVLGGAIPQVTENFHFRIDWKRAFAKSQLFKFSI